MSDFKNTGDSQLISSIRNTLWIDLSPGHKELREFLESQVLNACVDQDDISPIMVKGAFGIGKTATLHYLFHYAWTKLHVPTFMLNLDRLNKEIKAYLNANGLEELPNNDVSKVVGDILDAQVQLLKSKEFDKLNGGEIFFPTFDKFNLMEYLGRFHKAILHSSDNGGFIDSQLPLFDKKIINTTIENGNRCLLLIDEFESKYHDLTRLIESSGGGPLRQFFDDVATVASSNFYCIIGNGPASGYEVGGSAAEQRRLLVKQIQMPTVKSLSKSFLKSDDFPKEYINFIWWLSRARPGQIKLLKESLRPITEQNENNYTQFIRTNDIFKNEIDDIGESNVKFLKSEIFTDYDHLLQEQIKNSLICLAPRELNISDDEVKDNLLRGKNLFSTSKEVIKYEILVDAVKDDFAKQDEYQKIESEKIFNYLDLILESISDSNGNICFGFLGKSNTDKAMVDTFLHPLWSLLYDMMTIYEDENDFKIKNALDFLLIQNKISDDYENIDRSYKSIYNLFEINQQREDEIYIQLNLNTIRETIEQPIGSPKLPYKSESLDDKIDGVDSIDKVFIWNNDSNKNEEIIIIPNYADEELLQSYLVTLTEYFENNWSENKNYFGDGKLVTNIVYLKENLLIGDFKKRLCYNQENEELPYKLKRLDVKHIDTYQIHNTLRISDYVSSLVKIATAGLYNDDIQDNDLKKYIDENDSIVRIDKIIDHILKGSWTESKQTRRTIEYFRDLLIGRENSSFNQILITAKESYNQEISEYFPEDSLRDYSYPINLSDDDHFQTVKGSVATKNFISFLLSSAKEDDYKKTCDFIDKISKQNLNPENKEEDLTLPDVNNFIKVKHKDKIDELIKDYSKNDKTSKGIKRYLNLIATYEDIESIDDFVELLNEESLLISSYFDHLKFSSKKSYFLKGLYLRQLETNLIKEAVNSSNRVKSERSITTSDDFTVGDYVEHDRFGKGKIVAIGGTGGNQSVAVVFKGGLKKTLIVKFANLKRLETELARETYLEIETKLSKVEYIEKLENNLSEKQNILQELRMSLDVIYDELKKLYGFKKEIINTSDIDDYYTKIITPYLSELKEGSSISYIILGKYINDTIDYKIDTIEKFISQLKKLAEIIEPKYEEINQIQSEINELYSIESELLKRLFKNKYSSERNGDYFYKNVFLQSIKLLENGEVYNNIFTKAYTPSGKYFIEGEHLKKLEEIIENSFENKKESLDETFNSLKVITINFIQTEDLEYKICSLLGLQTEPLNLSEYDLNIEDEQETLVFDTNSFDDKYNTEIDLLKKDVDGNIQKEIEETGLRNNWDGLIEEKNEVDKDDKYKKYQKNLKCYFKELYKVITAPGVKIIIDWIRENDYKESITKKKINCLEEFLTDQYVDYRNEINSIIDNSQSINKHDKSLFNGIKKNIMLNIIKTLVNYDNDKDEFFKELDGFITDLNILLDSISEIEELDFTDVKQFYTEYENGNGTEIIDKKVDFYLVLIERIIEKNDEISTDQSQVTLDNISKSVQDNIDDITNSIELLKSLGLSQESDRDTLSIYNKFEKSIHIKSVGHCSKVIKDEIENTWNPIIEDYYKIEQFFEEYDENAVPSLLEIKSNWESINFPPKIEEYLVKIKSIFSDNPINTIGSTEIDEIRKQFGKKCKDIKNLDEDDLKEEIIEFCCSDIIKSYESKKIVILEKLDVNIEKISEIRKNLKMIQSFSDNLSSEENLLGYLKDALKAFIDRVTKNIEKYKNLIENSPIKGDLPFLENFDISGESEEIDQNYLIDHFEEIKRLLEYDLISLKGKKNV